MDPKLELKLKQESFKDIENIKQEINRIHQSFYIVDQNMKASHAVLVADLTNLTIRVNFIIKILKEKFPDENYETKFKEFADGEQAKIEEQIKKMQANVKGKTNGN